MENVKNVNEINENLNEISEDKINLVKDFTKIIRTIKIVPTKTKYATTYHAVVDLSGMYTFKVRVDENLANYITLCGKLNIKPFKVKTVVKEFSPEKGREFICLKFVTTKDNVYRYFIDRVDSESLELIYDNAELSVKK